MGGRMGGREGGRKGKGGGVCMCVKNTRTGDVHVDTTFTYHCDGECVIQLSSYDTDDS